jgi:tripartite ATP-independent transporter DctP family solute receptor
MYKKVLMILVAALAIVSIVSAQATKPQFEFKLYEIHETTYPTTQGDIEFARLVNVGTQGRVHITVYDNGQLGSDEKAIVEQTQMGAMDFARISLAPLAQFVPALNVLTLPYIYRDGTHMWKVLQGPIGMNLLSSIDKANLVGLCYYDAGARNFYNSVKEIKSLADLKGMKFRVQQAKLPMDMVTALGASPTPMATGDVYSAIQTHVIDGAENNWPSYISFSHYEVAKYFTVDGHTRVPEVLVASKLSLSKLAKADQDVVMKSAAASVEYQKALWAKSEKDNEAKAKAAGCVITYLDAATLADFQNAMAPVYAQYKDYADLIAQIQAVK